MCMYSMDIEKLTADEQDRLFSKIPSCIVGRLLFFLIFQ